MTASLQSLISFVAISLTTACAGLSLGGSTNTPSSTPSSAPPGTPASASATASTSATPAAKTSPGASSSDLLFVGLTDAASTENARRFKEELRSGSIARVFDETTLVNEVTAICGTKIWDQCDVARSDTQNEHGWPQWAFKRKDAERVYLYPDMFYAIAEPRWAAAAVEYILRSDKGAELVKLVQDKCGKPFTAACQVRQRHNGSYVLTVKTTGEVINVMDTLTQWRRDL